MATSPMSSRWLFLPLLLATISFVMAAVDLLAAVISFVRTDRPMLGITLPSIILLLSALTLRLGMSALRPLGGRGMPPKWMCWLALLFGATMALLAGAEFVYSFMEEGIVVLLDFPIVIAFLLSLSCTVLAYLGLRSQPQSL